MKKVTIKIKNKKYQAILKDNSFIYSDHLVHIDLAKEAAVFWSNKDDKGRRYDLQFISEICPIIKVADANAQETEASLMPVESTSRTTIINNNQKIFYLQVYTPKVESVPAYFQLGYELAYAQLSECTGA